MPKFMFVESKVLSC